MKTNRFTAEERSQRSFAEEEIVSFTLRELRQLRSSAVNEFAPTAIEKVAA
jgi:hypothetical protein